MTDASTFGGQLDAGTTFGAGFSGDGSAPSVPMPDTVAQPPATSPGGFGSMLHSVLPGPNYTPPDPNASALDQTADTLQQRIQRANSIATNPMLQLFNPEGVAAARNFIPAATEQLQKIRQQKAGMQANREQAATLGLDPGEVPDEATQADRVAIAQNRALKGDLRVFQGLQAVDPKAAEAIQDRVHQAAATHLDNAQLAFDSLAGMQNQGQYAAKLAQLQRDGTLTDLTALGLKVPPTFDAFNATKTTEAAALRDARIGLNTIRDKLEARNTYQPMEKKEAETYNGRLTTAYGDQITNGSWSRNAATNARGLVVNGMDDPRNLGKTFTLATPEQRTAIKDEFAHAVPDKDIEKYRANNRTYQLATTDAKGNKLPDGAINTNPNVQQGIAEGLASMLRGGSGGANVGLLKIETSKRGAIQGFIDNIVGNYAGTLNELTAEQVKPYLSKLTQSQQRDVLDMLKGYNDSNIGDRTSQIAQRAGALGLDAAALGFGKNEATGAIGDALEQGRQAQIARMMPHHQAIGGGDGVLQLGAQRPGAGAAPLPAGVTPTNQQPGMQPLATPVQQNLNPPVPPADNQPPQSGGNPPAAPNNTAGGGPVPVTIAGQQVNFTPPPGASPNYLPNLQRIESGKEKSPWTAGNNMSSAGGAFQAIKSTWMQNKPAGAPDDPRKATPQQQADFASTLTAKNAASLQSAGLPVNDTNLYVAHNLGAGGASALLRAAPNADARTVVGEDAARNNPLFFRGKPTVATVLARYQAEMNGSLNDRAPAPMGEPKPVIAGPPPEQPQSLWAKVGNLLSGAQNEQEMAAQRDAEAESARMLGRGAVENAPAILSTAGAVGGSLLGPAGTLAGGGAGGVIGNRLRNYAQGNPQSMMQDAKQGALGVVLGVAPEGRPLLGAAARVLGAGGVNAGVTAAEGGSTPDVIDAATQGAGYALGGEALGRFVSSAGAQAYKALSRYTTGAQQELSAAAGKLAAARSVLETEQPKVGDVANPKYEAAQKAAEEAEQAIKDHGQNPDDMVHAYEQAKAGVSSGEALVMRPGQKEKTEVSKGYDQLRSDVQDAGVGAVKPQKVPDGPVSMLRTADNPTGKVPEQFRPEAEHAELLVTAPAQNWGDKWQQLQNAGSELIKKRLDFLAAGDKSSAQAMDNLFQGVRNQQKAAAEYVFGKEQGAKVITQLENLDTRYAKVMNATGGMSYEKMQSTLASGNTPARRELEKNFTEFAKDDPSALRAFQAMKAGARGDWKTEAALMGPVIAGEVAANMGGVPTVGAISALIGGHRLYKMVQGYMNARLLGKAVMFKDFLAQEVKTGLAKIAGTATQRAAVQR